MKASSASKPPNSRIRPHIAETRMVTIMVSNMPDAPLPMLPSMDMGSTVPVARVMIIPEKIPTSSTTNTLIPAMPPASTST